jgi:hypothetical protein
MYAPGISTRGNFGTAARASGDYHWRCMFRRETDRPSHGEDGSIGSASKARSGWSTQKSIREWVRPSGGQPDSYSASATYRALGWLPRCEAVQSSYSYFSATMGSTRVARRAGM